jgi:hypothetical protein
MTVECPNCSRAVPDRILRSLPAGEIKRFRCSCGHRFRAVVPEIVDTLVEVEPYYEAIKREVPKYYDGPEGLKRGDDRVKAEKQTEGILWEMRDRVWRTVPELIDRLRLRDTSREWLETSVSADLRNLRKDKFGGYTVERRKRMGVTGIHEYRLADPLKETA